MLLAFSRSFRIPFILIAIMSIGLLQQALHNINIEKQRWLTVGQRTPQRVNYWMKWLAPGLLIKRWLLLSITGMILATLGAAIWVGLTPVYRLMGLVSEIIETLARVLPNSLSGPLALALGLVLLVWGQSRSVGSITEVLHPGDGEELIDRLLAHRRLNRGPKIVAIGGGTGLSTILRGLKEYSANITAIVTVADDGGSSGRLRREMGTLPPGDIRNCVAALATEEELLTQLFQYRFNTGDGLSGHSFGNLFLTAMTDITGDPEKAIAASSKVLAVRGRVLPATLSDVCLWAEMTDGRRIEGESQIPHAEGRIARVGCTPANPPALPAAIKAIEEADFIILGPGSLYTSVIPNLLVPEIRDAIARTKVPRIYACNIMTQPGETDNYTVADHIRAIDRACGQKLFDAVVVNRRYPSAHTLIQYAQDNSHPVFCDREAITQLGRRIIAANILDEDPKTGYVRHDHQRLARVLLRWYGKSNGFQNRIDEVLNEWADLQQ